MRARLTFGIAAALAAGGLGTFAGMNEANRRALERQADEARREAESVRASWKTEQRALETQVLRAASAKPLLAALDSDVDGPTLVDLFQSEDWWRTMRADFSLSRVIVGQRVLATYGAPDPGSADREIVASARAERVASTQVTLDGRPYFLLATRLYAMPGKDPVLVVAKAVDTKRLGTFVEPMRPPARSSLDVGAGAAAAGLGLLAIVLIVSGAFGRRRASVPAPPVEGAFVTPGGRLITLPPGAVLLPPAAGRLSSGSLLGPSSGPAVPGASFGASSLGIPAAAPVPPPRSVANTPGPVGPPRHASAPEGVPATGSAAPGTPFGRYQLLDRLGEGGMSEVFTAAAYGVEGFSRVFVLKRLKAELARDKEAMGQFIDEARMQASLVHSNIVPVFDFGQVGAELFMTQEYIVGRDMVRLIARLYDQRRQALSPRLAYYFAHETLLALQYAHTKCDREGRPLGIVHRDVSPANVIVSAQGEVKLSDFGIVKANHRVTRTQAGMVKGNVNFMSPEQAKGKDVDARSDLFSMGLVLYYCLTNQFLYDGDNDLDVLFKAACGPTKEHRDRVEQLPSPAREILGKALAIDPGERFQSAAEFADMLALHIGGAKSEAAKLMQALFGEELLREAA
jgi:hypothetical protein